MKIAPFVAAALAAAPCLCAESVTLTPTDDSDVYSYTTRPTSTNYTLGINSSYGQNATTGQWESALHSQRSVVQFNVSSVSIPADEIGKAVLRLYLLQTDTAQGGSNAGGQMLVQQQATAWTTSTLRWSMVSASTQTTVATVTVPSSYDTWIEVDVTSAVKAWKAGTVPNYGFLLRPASETSTPNINVVFASMEWAATTQAGIVPQLVITRQVIPPVLSVASGPAAGQVTLSWPVSGSTGWTLQRSTTLNGDWAADSTTSTSDGTTYKVVHSVSEAGSAFFRLVK